MRYVASCLLDVLEWALVIAMLLANEPIMAIKCGFGVIILILLRE